jgi:hypothetical protein
LASSAKCGWTWFKLEETNGWPNGRSQMLKGNGIPTTVSVYECDVYVFICFCYGFHLKGMRVNNRFCKDSLGIVRFTRSHWDCGIRSCGLIETAGSDPVVSIHCWIRFCGLMETVEESITKILMSDPRISLKPQKLVELRQRNFNFANIVWWKKPRVENLGTLFL